MLIQSDRHTKSDIALWTAMEQADKIHGRTAALTAKTTRAIQAIQDFARSGACYCSTSWGKDSVVVAYLAWASGADIALGNLRVVPTRNPYCDAVRDAFLARHPMPYYEVVVDYSGVDREIVGNDYDKQTNKIWAEGFRELERRVGANRHISGIRGQESPGRMIRVCRWGESSPNACAPLGRWSVADVFGFLAARDLPVHPNYAMLGGGRWDRNHIRTAEIGDSHGRRMGRAEWETEYYGDVVAMVAAQAQKGR